ncbi:hypothetical protein ACFCXH_00155 [Streptomyces nojiriensis]|uniref:hypothetical protein n=1 Tax=Streptomyces nojiriensis TaxID=66374 RepID=UPI0035D55B4B
MGNLQEARPTWNFASADPGKLWTHPSLDYMSWTSSVHPREYAERLDDISRTSFFAHIVGILHDFHVAPALKGDGALVCDSYDYRFRAKVESLYPSTRPLLDAMAEMLPRPDLVLWLDLPLKEAWRRKGGTCSSFEGTSKDEAGFVALQTAVERLIFEKYLVDTPVRRLDATQEPHILSAGVLEAVDHLIGSRAPAYLRAA